MGRRALFFLAATLTLVLQPSRAQYNGIEPVILIPGDVIVVGIFKVQTSANGRCDNIDVTSVMEIEAIRWYLSNLNAARDIQLKIGFHAYKTCVLPGIAAEITNKVIYDSLINTTNPIIGILGPSTSSETEIVSATIGFLRSERQLVQIGYSATAERLSNREWYPNFFRVIQNDEVQVQMIISTMNNLHWNRIAIIHEDDIYGTDTSRALETLAKDNGICVTVVRSISSGDVSTDELFLMLESDIILKNPAVTCVVFIGSCKKANLILKVLDESHASNLPNFIFSESIGLQSSVFRTKTGQTMASAKGSFVVSNKKQLVTEFESYWKGLFLNISRLQEEAISNPWLNDVYLYLRECETSLSCPYKSFSGSEIDKEFHIQPVYVMYAVTAAHVLTEAFQNVFDTICNGQNPCPLFQEIFYPGLLIEEMYNLTIDFETDFASSVPSLASSAISLQFNGQTDAELPIGQLAYELYNFRKASEVEAKDDFDFIKVGEYRNMAAILNTDQIRDYGSTGNERRWPDIRTAQCASTYVCEECLPEDVGERFLFIPGDLYVVALVPVYGKSSSGCDKIRDINGYQLVETILYYWSKFQNRDDAYAAYFSGKEIGLVVLNTCNDPVETQRKILNLYHSGLTLRSGAKVDIKGKILGYVGPLASTTTLGVVEILSSFGALMLPYASTNPVLSDRSRYPNLLRPVNPVNRQVEAMITIIQQQGSDYIQVMYSAGAYGEGARDKLIELTKVSRICLAQLVEVEEDETGAYHWYTEILRRVPHARTVIIFVRSHVVPDLMADLLSDLDRGEFNFIASDAWGKNADILLKDRGRKLQGSFTLLPDMKYDSDLLEHMNRFEPYFELETGSNMQFGVEILRKLQSKINIHENTWALEYLQAKRNCYYPLSFDKTFAKQCPPRDGQSRGFELDTWTTTIADSFLALLVGAGRLYRMECGSEEMTSCEFDATQHPERLYEELLKLSRSDLYSGGSAARIFDANGDGNLNISVYSIQRQTDNPQDLEYVLSGTYTPSLSRLASGLGGFQSTDYLASKCPSEKTCNVCFNATAEQSAHSGTDVRSIVLGSLLGVACLITAALIVWVVSARRNGTTKNTHDGYLSPIDLPTQNQVENGAYSNPQSHINPELFSETV